MASVARTRPPRSSCSPRDDLARPASTALPGAPVARVLRPDQWRVRRAAALYPVRRDVRAALIVPVLVAVPAAVLPQEVHVLDLVRTAGVVDDLVPGHHVDRLRGRHDIVVVGAEQGPVGATVALRIVVAPDQERRVRPHVPTLAGDADEGDLGAAVRAELADRVLDIDVGRPAGQVLLVAGERGPQDQPAHGMGDHVNRDAESGVVVPDPPGQPTAELLDRHFVVGALAEVGVARAVVGVDAERAQLGPCRGGPGTVLVLRQRLGPVPPVAVETSRAHEVELVSVHEKDGLVEAVTATWRRGGNRAGRDAGPRIGAGPGVASGQVAPGLPPAHPGCRAVALRVVPHVVAAAAVRTVPVAHHPAPGGVHVGGMRVVVRVPVHLGAATVAAPPTGAPRPAGIRVADADAGLLGTGAGLCR